MVDLTFQRSIEAEPLPGRANPRLPEQADPFAFGAGVGSAVSSAGDVVQNVQNAQAAAAARSQALDFNNKLQLLDEKTLHDPQTGALLQQGENAINLSGKVLPKWDQQAQAFLGSIPSASARGVAQNMLEQHRQNMQEQLDKHEGDQIQKHYDAVDKTAVALGIQGAIQNRNDPAIIQNNLDGIDVALANTAQRQGWDPSQLNYARQEAHSQLHEGVLNGLISDGNLDVASAYLDHAKDQVSPQDAARLHGILVDGQTAHIAQSIADSFRNAGPDVGAKVFQQLDSMPIADDQKNKVREQVDQQLTLLNKERRTQYANTITNLETSIAAGTPLPNARAVAASLYHSYALDQSQYATTLSGIVRAEKDRKKVDDLLDYGMAAYNSNRPLDPKNPDDNKAMNQVLTQISGDAEPGSSAYGNAAVAVTQRSGIIPSNVVSWGRTQMNNGDPATAATAANLLARLEQTNPRAYGFAVDESDKETKALVSSINNATAAGTPAPVAVEMARANSKLTQADRNALDAKWKQLKAEQSQGSALSSVLGQDPVYKPGWFSSVPAPPPLMQGQFDQLTQDYFHLTQGNLDQARQLAAQDLKRTWGVSEVNGRRELMQFAPEAMFPGLTAADVHSDLAATVSTHAQSMNHLDPATGSLVSVPVDPKTVRLVPTDITARTGGLKGWQLVAPDKFGANDVLLDRKGNPLSYQLPVQAKDFSAIQDRANAESMRQAREQQQLRQDSQKASMDEIDQAQRLGNSRFTFR